MRRVALAVLIAASVSACSSAPQAAGLPAPASAASSAGQRFPDIVDATVTGSGDQFTFQVSVSSPYDTPQRYADAFRARSADGATVYGITEVTHDHATEQPFTRTLTVTIPAGVTSVVVEGRDQANGWGGGTRTVELVR